MVRAARSSFCLEVALTWRLISRQQQQHHHIALKRPATQGIDIIGSLYVSLTCGTPLQKLWELSELDVRCLPRTTRRFILLFWFSAECMLGLVCGEAAVVGDWLLRAELRARRAALNRASDAQVIP